MSVLAYKKILIYVNPSALQLIHFFNKRLRVNNNTVANNTGFSSMQYSGWDEMKNKFFIFYNNCMPCIMTALIPGYNAGILG
jgi:hypothetical protein